MDFGQARKRGKPDAPLNGNAAGFKKNKKEMENFPGIGSKSKPCTKFFSTAGCPFGEGCHFLHYAPSGVNVAAQIANMGGNPVLPPRSTVGPPSRDGSSVPAKTRMCNKFNTADGCKFGDKCHFAHDERELVKQPGAEFHDDPRGMGPPGGRLTGWNEAPPQATGFGASATAKISVDASLAGAIIGKGGSHSKQICRMTGAKLSIRDHETDPNLRNIELEGSFDQIGNASTMVRELIMKIGSAASAAPMRSHAAPVPPPASSNFKTKMCENFTKGSCTFGERCHFAHGAAELRKPGV